MSIDLIWNWPLYNTVPTSIGSVIPLNNAWGILCWLQANYKVENLPGITQSPHQIVLCSVWIRKVQFPICSISLYTMWSCQWKMYPWANWILITIPYCSWSTVLSRLRWEHVSYGMCSGNIYSWSNFLWTLFCPLMHWRHEPKPSLTH